jgi:protoporphyrinogen oxidase
MKKVLIIGAGPAGLTAAYEFQKLNKGYEITLLEELDQVGGISKTVVYKGNRIDIGGHRFFSKSDVVMNWWQDILPIDPTEKAEFSINYQNQSRTVAPKPTTIADKDKIMLIRNRLSRIFYLRKFFDYPIKINLQTVGNLGMVRIAKIFFSYLAARVFPIKVEKSLEDFFINRFGKQLYRTFFKDYTEKVWGVSCQDIKPEWGAQRIKGLSITTAIVHFAKSLVQNNNSISQKNIETSLIERFMYPKLGPGQLWEEVRDRCLAAGATLHYHQKVVQLERSQNNTITAVVTTNSQTGQKQRYKADYVISTMPIKDLVNAISPVVDQRMLALANSLVYRDFITVGLLLSDLKIKNADKTDIQDNWIYIQEPDVKVGRLQIFNNWSPYMVAKPGTYWIGLEYFCNEGDFLWEMDESTMKEFAKDEMVKIGIIDKNTVLDSVVVKVPKTYPAYVGGYDNFDELRGQIDAYENLFLIGRNGMHRYNNQDHSMLTAILAVENIDKGITNKDNIWEVNTEEEYHEEK